MALKKSLVETEKESLSLSPELMNQFQSNFASSTHQENIAVVPETLKTSVKKINYKNIFNLHLGTGDKARLKAFCAAHEIPINTFVLFAIEHLIDEVEDKKCTVSKSGIRTLKSGVKKWDENE